MNKNKYEELKNKIDKEIQLIEEHKSKLNELIEEMEKAEQEENSSNGIPLRLEDKAREFRKTNNCDVDEEDLKNINNRKYYIYYNLIKRIFPYSYCGGKL